MAAKEHAEPACGVQNAGGGEACRTSPAPPRLLPAALPPSTQRTCPLRAPCLQVAHGLAGHGEVEECASGCRCRAIVADVHPVQEAGNEGRKVAVAAAGSGMMEAARHGESFMTAVRPACWQNVCSNSTRAAAPGLLGQWRRWRRRAHRQRHADCCSCCRGAGCCPGGHAARSAACQGSGGALQRGRAAVQRQPQGHCTLLV